MSTEKPHCELLNGNCIFPAWSCYNCEVASTAMMVISKAAIPGDAVDAKEPDITYKSGTRSHALLAQSRIEFTLHGTPRRGVLNLKVNAGKLKKLTKNEFSESLKKRQ